jgi:hypothetical protein
VSIFAMSATADVIIYQETFDTGNMAGWTDRTAYDMTVTNSDFGYPGGSLVGTFGQQSIPSPETDAFRATSMSSVGAFVGDYWEDIGAFNGWQFSFYADDTLPSSLVLRFRGNSSVFFLSVSSQLADIDTWYDVAVPAAYGSGWVGGDEAAFSNALSSVEWVEVQVTRSGTMAQSYYMDNFDNGTWKGAMAIPEASVLMLCISGALLLHKTRKHFIK